MGKPRLIILIRHAQSEGNKNRAIHQSIPDHRVNLTQDGHKQALEAGRKLRSLLRPDDTLHFFTSPYRRTRETTEGILESLTSDDPSPSPFPRHTIKVYEEPRLREQDFGNFQPCAAEMERMWQERADYGHFFYRIPNGESAADAYDRVSHFNDSLWRRFGEEDFASVCILVTHGLMTRVFLMKWYHFSVEYFEDLRNVNHCEFVVMKKNKDNGKYILQNQLRTWSELKRERAARGSISMPKELSPQIPTRRKWGGCPDGCGHAKHGHYIRKTPIRQNTADLFKDDDSIAAHSPVKVSRSNSKRRPPPTIQMPDSDEEQATPSDSLTEEEPKSKTSRHKPGNLKVPSSEEIVSSPDGTPSYISLASMSTEPFDSNNERYRQISNHLIALGGRDGGGSASGAASRDVSSGEEQDDERDTQSAWGNSKKGAFKPMSLARALHGELNEQPELSPKGRSDRAMADALGDQSDAEVEEEDEANGDIQRQKKEEEKIFQEERYDRSVQGSVY
ncbi:MAG: hypothetical protein Q9227_006904 [Pyrenula ochraceoflavens]